MKLLKDLLSVIIVLILIVLEIVYGCLFCVKNTIDEKSISHAIQDVDFNAVMYDENGELTEVGKSLNDMLLDMGLSMNASKEILESETLKRSMGDFIATAIVSTVDDSVEIIYPSKKDLKDFVGETYDIIAKEQKMEASKEEVLKSFDEDYDELINELEKFTADLDKNLNLNENIDFGISSGGNTKSNVEMNTQIPKVIEDGGR